MNLYGIAPRRLPIAVLAICLLFLLAACGSDPTSTVAPTAEATAPAATTEAPATLAPTNTPAPTPTPTVEPTPTPAPTPTPSAEEMLDDLLSSVEEKLADMSTAEFDMTDETESGAPFFGTEFKSLTGQVKSPDSFWMQVKVVVPALGFAEIEMMAVGEDALMKFSEGAPWTPLPLDQVPFNFRGLGVTLSQLVPAMSDVTLIGQETVGDTETTSFEGTIPSEGMDGPDHGRWTRATPITLTFWVDEDRAHAAAASDFGGKLFNDDGPETTRLLDIKGVNAPGRHPASGRRLTRQ